MKPPPTASRRRVLALLALSTVASPVLALGAPASRVLLAVTGDIAHRNAADAAQFDLAMLEAMSRHSLSTRTPWFPSPRKFTGVRLRDVLDAVGARGTTLRAVALNDYRVDIPVADARTHDVLLAWLLDDRPMAVRDKGPLVIIYPFDDHPELRTAVHYGRAAWQLKQLDVR